MQAQVGILHLLCLKQAGKTNAVISLTSCFNGKQPYFPHDNSLNSPPASAKKRITCFLAGTRMQRLQSDLFSLQYVHHSSYTHTRSNREGELQMSYCHIFTTLASVRWLLSPVWQCCALTVGATAVFPVGCDSAKLVWFFVLSSDYGPVLQIAF